MKIIYHASDDTMGDTTPDGCDAYRLWAEDQIQEAFPEHIVTVTDRPSLEPVWTDDEDQREAIIEFCHELWDRCPWELFWNRPDAGE